MLKFVSILALTLSFSAFAQEDYQETDYTSGGADQEMDRGLASDGSEVVETAPIPEENHDASYDSSAE